MNDIKNTAQATARARVEEKLHRLEMLSARLEHITEKMRRNLPQGEMSATFSGEEPLWFSSIGILFSMFLPMLLVIWSYYYLRFRAVEAEQLPQIIAIAIVLAAICAIIRVLIIILSPIKPESRSALHKLTVVRRKEKALRTALRKTGGSDTPDATTRQFPTETGAKLTPFAIHRLLRKADRNMKKLTKISFSE